MNLKKNNFIYTYLKSVNNYFNKLTKDKRKFLLTLVSILVILFVLTKFRSIFFTILLILLGAVSMIYIRFFKYSHYVAFELCTLATVLTTLAYGPHVGAFSGFMSITLGFVISGYFKPQYFISDLALPLVALIVPFLSHLDLWQIGVIVTIVYDLIILPLYVLFGSRIVSTIVFFITHVLLNYWIFSTIAPFIYSIMI